MSPWYVAAGCAALAHWVNGASLEPLRRFVKPAPHAAQELQPGLWTRQRFASELEERWSAYAAEARDDDPLSLDAMASHLMEIVFLRQLHLLAPVHEGKVPLASTDARVEKALAVMRKKLEKTSALLRPRART